MVDKNVSEAFNKTRDAMHFNGRNDFFKYNNLKEKC